MKTESDTTKSSASPKTWRPPKSLHVEPSVIGSGTRYNVFDGDGLIATKNAAERKQLAAFLQAAPEMLDALKALTGLIRDVQNVYGVSAGTWLMEKPSFKAAEAAILKAEGKQ